MNKDFKLERVTVKEFPNTSDGTVTYIRETTSGYVELENDDAVENSIYNILNTKQGSVFFNELFGCNLHLFLHEKATVGNFMSIRREITTSLKNFEPRINIVDIGIRIENNSYVIQLSYVNLMSGNGSVSEFVLDAIS